MLSDTELEARLRALDLPEAGIAYIHRVRTSPPSRNVSSTGKRNTTWRYASQKMACTIQGESTLERNFLVHCEYTESVAEFWDQPETVSVTFISKAGRPQRVPYTADVLVIEDGAVIAYQVKPRSDCVRLVEQRPSRWSHKDSGFEDVSATEAFSALGIGHRVVTEDDISAIAAENYSLLLQAQRSSHETPPDHARRILTVLAEDGVLTVGSLLQKAAGIESTSLLRLISSGHVFALLDKHRLADHDDALVGLEKSDLEDVSTNRLLLAKPARAEGTPHVEAPSIAQLKILVWRLRQLKSIGTIKASEKTLKRWRRTLDDAKGDVRALVPRTDLRGNRTRRLGAENLALIAQTIDQKVLVANAGSTTAAYYAYVHAHEERHGKMTKSSGAKPASLPTFFAEVNRIPVATRCAAQGGSRLANAFVPPVDPNARSLKPLRPFERAHVDHYLIDQHVVVLRTGGRKKITKRAWLTAMIDQATTLFSPCRFRFGHPAAMPAHVSFVTVSDVTTDYPRPSLWIMEASLIRPTSRCSWHVTA